MSLRQCGSMDAGVDTGAACGLEYGTRSCASCVSAHCCPESSACAADPACAPNAACVGACAGDPTCRARCTLDSPPGNSTEGPALTACLAAQCEGECGLTCGGVSNGSSYGGVPPDAAAACQGCIAANGCDEARACGASVDCDALRLCTGVCATFDCLEACDSAHDAGLALESALANITGGPCAVACARGADWSCVGHRSWPRAPSSDTVTMTIQVKDYGSGSTLPGVDVSVCDRNDVDCSSAVAHGSTDATGSVVLQVPNRVDMGFMGLDGYVQVLSPDDAVAGPKIVPYLYYWGFPLSEPEFAQTDAPAWNASLRVLTRDELDQLGTSVGVPYDPTSSLLVAFPTDCESRVAPGVEITTVPPIRASPKSTGWTRPRRPQLAMASRRSPACPPAAST